ncbi:hypothetical protein STCU_01937 [Strigomonas culicis]|uniref:Uncharacterized protein n=1 Tax=Strigomonas culicis TaxID=28005 RepID=S9UYK6_9TRYP|nr:hypothetical protein STCU_02894 [Strigomonas culicis]EPY33829.1 hypothetical protein STCU_01937 [Strigomonas culicis]|eukprot:EPY32272.1 hypothetical protein STCU_02894 [Strigomonas culicis]
MPTIVEDPAPCAVEAALWRVCLKEYDYGPDRPKGACELQRGKYYGCLKEWTNRTQEKQYSYKNFEMTSQCAHEAEKLHQCMMMNMFEVSHCQKDMTVLKRCAAAHDPEVRRSLADDPAIKDLENSVDNATGVRRLWYKAIGKL